MNLLNLVLLQFVNLSTPSVRIMPINVFDVLSMLINFQSQDNPYFRKIISIEFYLCFCFYFELKDIVLHGSEETQRLGEILRIHIVLMIPPIPQSPPNPPIFPMTSRNHAPFRPLNHTQPPPSFNSNATPFRIFDLFSFSFI